MSHVKAALRLWDYRELLSTLVWKEIVVRYKQAYLGIAWTVLKPVMLMLVFTLMRSFIGIDSGSIPYPVLTFTALIPWVFFQEGVALGVNSIVLNAGLVKKIYFPREVFPLVSVLTKMVEFCVDFAVLLGLMAWYGLSLTTQAAWLPLLLAYLVLTTLAVNLAGAALNVFYRDVSQFLPVAISLVMYASPIIYPLSLVKRVLLVSQAAGVHSDLLYFLYTLNPLVGIVDAFQSVLLRNQPPDFSVIWPGALFVAMLLPASYEYFKRAEHSFADVI
ncbi:ABC transporter permease [Solidesulfovibrio sp.]|uniref:ABC transporter permease n=1 Tax=Solidesulfovibrio sp. TaxID=2910990 RepID=UPI002618D408|nr:ABC transporter permease [Solidesulfovibrio sp.]